MKKLIPLFFIPSLVMVLFYCKSKSKSQSKERNRFENSRILMSKGECYGYCPVYSIVINGTGKVQFEGKKNVKKQGKFEKQLTEKEISKIFNEFECANFFDFHSEYTAEITDLPTTYLTFEHRDFKKQVMDYYNAPEELKKLEKLVEDIATNEAGWKKVE
jgi:hypothetical protein